MEFDATYSLVAMTVTPQPEYHCFLKGCQARVSLSGLGLFILIFLELKPIPVGYGPNYDTQFL